MDRSFASRNQEERHHDDDDDDEDARWMGRSWLDNAQCRGHDDDAGPGTSPPRPDRVSLFVVCVVVFSWRTRSLKRFVRGVAGIQLCVVVLGPYRRTCVCLTVPIVVDTARMPPSSATVSFPPWIF